MEKNSKQKLRKRVVMTALFSVFAAAFVFTASPITAQAATRKVTASSNWKKAPALKVGTNKVTEKKVNTYVKFTAPKTGTYTFAMSEVAQINPPNPDPGLGHWTISKWKGYLLSAVKVSTNGGKTNYLNMATQYSYDKFFKGKKATKNQYLATRYGKLKLKKGETVYIKYYHTRGGCTYTMKVKMS